MKKASIHLFQRIGILLLGCGCVPLTAQEPSVLEPVSIAVLDFQQVDTQKNNLKSLIESTLENQLSAQKSILLVERQQLGTLLEEQGMSLSGMVNPSQAIQAGKLIGAQIMITGKIIAYGKETMISVKIIGTETGRVEADKEVFDNDAIKITQVDAFAKRIADLIAQNANELVPVSTDDGDVIANLKKELRERVLPAMSISVPEIHMTRQIPDPAAETAIANLWQKLGGEVVTANSDAPPVLVITGEAFSEFAIRKGELVSCMARVEIKAVNRKSGEVVFQGAAHSVAVDLGENIAAKKALTQAGNNIGVNLVKTLAQNNDL